MSELKIKGITIVETFAEAFPMVGTRIIKPRGHKLLDFSCRTWSQLYQTSIVGQLSKQQKDVCRCRVFLEEAVVFFLESAMVNVNFHYMP